jgi:glycosyltransferase involved in cell wall biosynthesis
MGYPRDTILVALREYGLPHEPWMRRQISGMSMLDFEILCWKRHPVDGSPIQTSDIHIVDLDPAPFDGNKRWMYRFANLGRKNFYAVRGIERRKIKDVISAINPASLLCHDGTIALKLIDICQEHKLPLIGYFHGDFRWLHDRWYRWSLEMKIRKFAAVVVVSQQEREWMVTHGVPASRLHVIPCGAPTTLFVPSRQRHTGEVRFVMASRLADEKGCKESVLAFADVALRHENVSLHIYGDGPERERLEKIVATRGLNGRVKFHGYVSEATLVAAFPECDVLIQHSIRREGSPVSIIEAMSCGLPVVATAIGGIVDQVVDGETGFLVAEGDTVAMSRAMLRLVEDAALRARLGANARNRAVESFDSALMTTRLQELLVDCNRTRRGAVGS